MRTTGQTPLLDARRAVDFLARAADAGPAPAGASFDDLLGGLTGLGLPPGGMVILALPNSVQAVGLHLAALVLGLVPLSVAPGTPSARVRALAERLDAGALVAHRIEPERYGARRTYRVGTAEAVLLDGGPTPYRPGDVLMLTSGTSGMYSACLHRADALLRNADRHATAVGMAGDDVVLVTLPLYYSYAMVAQVLAAFLRGARLVVSGPPFSPAAYRQTVARYGVTQSSVTPSVVRRLLARPEAALPGPRVLTVGGDRIAPEEVGALLAARPGGELYVTYGLTEAGPRVSTLAAHAEPARRHASVGLPLPGVRAYLRESGTGPTEPGELLVASDTVLVRKAGAPAPDGSRTLVAPGVVATGDVFRIDQDGYLYFQGRLSDFVVVRGEKVSLHTVRQAAYAIDGVVRCVPRLREDGEGGEVLEVEIGVAAPGPDTERSVRRALNAALLPAERPGRIVVTAADPAAFRK